MTAWGLFGVSVAYGPKRALHDFSVELRPGAIGALVGGDGAGKTTALRALVGVVSPSSGEARRPPATSLGYVSAASGLYPDLSVQENLTFAGTAYGLGRTQLRRRCDALLERTGLTAARDRLAERLSGGMRRKLALAAALIHSPALLVLDEPTTGIDPVSRSEVWRLIARAASDGAAVLVATSYMDEAERVEDIVVLSEGVTIASGPAEDIVAATPGRLFVSDERPPPTLAAWRRGARWHVWSEHDSDLPGMSPIGADLEDAVIVAELTSRRPAA